MLHCGCNCALKHFSVHDAYGLKQCWWGNLPSSMCFLIQVTILSPFNINKTIYERLNTFSFLFIGLVKKAEIKYFNAKYSKFYFINK